MTFQNKCVVSLGSVTAATRAMRALSKAAIYSEIIKLHDDPNGNGCIYGLEFGCSQAKNVRSVLKDAGIRVRRYFDGESEGYR